MTYTKPTQLKRFQAGMLAGMVSLGVAGLWTLAWFLAQTMAQSSLNDWIDQQQILGADVGYAALDVSGYPFNIRMKLTAPRYQGKLLDETVTWQGESLVASVRPWAPNTFIFETQGHHQLSFPSQNLDLNGSLKALTLSLSPGDTWPETLALSINGLNLTEDQASTGFKIGQFSARLNHDVETGSLSLRLNGTGLNLPPIVKFPLGNVVQNIKLDMQIDDPLTPEQLSADLSSVLPAWQQRDNKITVQNLNLRSGPLAVSTSGVIALDEDLQPTLAFTAKLEGLFQVLEVFRVKGLVSSTDAVVATMALSAFSKRPTNGGAASINLSITAEKGTLKLGPITIAQLPHFTWGIQPPEPIVEAVPEPRNYKDVPPIF